MFNKISSITLAVLLGLLLLFTQDRFYFYLGAVVVLIISSLGVNYKRLNFTWPHLMLPILYIVGVASIYGVISSYTIRLVFLGLAVLTFYWLEIKLGHESHFLQNIFLLSVFAWYIGLFAVQFYLKVPAAVFVVVVFFATYLFGLQGFAGFSLPAKKYFYILLSLVCAEAALGLLLWPTHFFVDAVVLFCVFYLLWLFSFSAFFGKLTRAKIYWQVALVVMVLAIVLSTTAWRPLS